MIEIFNGRVRSVIRQTIEQRLLFIDTDNIITIGHITSKQPQPASVSTNDGIHMLDVGTFRCVQIRKTSKGSGRIITALLIIIMSHPETNFEPRKDQTTPDLFSRVILPKSWNCKRQYRSKEWTLLPCLFFFRGSEGDGVNGPR